MQTQLRSILDRFLTGDNIQPILVSDNLACEIIRSLTKVAITHLDDLITEVVAGVYLYYTEDKTFKIESVRDLVEKTSIKPSGDFQIFVIRDVEKLSLAAANALLKTLEDVPERTLFILTTKTKENLLETIRSRVLVFWENSESFNLPSDLGFALDEYFLGSKKELVTLLYESKYERGEYIAFIEALIVKARQGKITNPNTIKLLEKSLRDIASTNANARWIVDNIIFQL